MENRYPVILQNGVRRGAIMGALFILLSLIYYIADFNMMNMLFGIVNFLVIIALYIAFLLWANKDVRNKKLNGWLTYPEGLLHAFIIGLVSAIISSAYNYLFYKFFDPEYLTQIGEKAIEMIENNPNIPQEALQEAERRISEMTPAKTALKGFYFNAAMSFIFALIVSIFTKKKQEDFTEAESFSSDEA
ncbi:MAG: DUF4199 domain-containing protein [Bacteroidales bacterium]